MKKHLMTLAAAATATLLAGCAQKQVNNNTLSGLDPSKFEATIDGVPTALYTLKNANGMEVCINNYGARIVSIAVPDKDGNLKDVIVGFDNLNDFREVKNEFGAVVGRYANRIGNAQIELDGVTYQLPKNNNGNTLHSGAAIGWAGKVYAVEAVTDNSITMTMTSPDGDTGFPGTVKMTVKYTLTDDNALDLDCRATTDKKTVINLTNHAYFNLSGDPTTDILDHVVYINADNYTPTDKLQIPTGEIAAVAGTPMDFTTAKPIGQDIEKRDFQAIEFGNGFDHNWVLNAAGDISVLTAKAYSPKSGIAVEVYTNEPGMQFYTGNFLDGQMIGKNGIPMDKRHAFCLETQHYPDSPHHDNFPTTVLEPGQVKHSECIYKFSVVK